MATCPNCGSKASGPFCDACGASIQEELSSRPPKQKVPVESRKPNGGRTQPSAARRRGWKASELIVAAVLLFAAGLGSGYYLGNRTSTAAAADSSLSPAELGDKYMQEGEDSLSKSDINAAKASFQKSITQFEKALAADPQNQYVRSLLGLVYFYVGNGNKAVETEKAVLEKDPNYLWAIFNLGWIYENGGQTADAIAMYQKYIEVAPKERENQLKYAQQLPLIDSQLAAAKNFLSKLPGTAPAPAASTAPATAPATVPATAPSK